MERPFYAAIHDGRSYVELLVRLRIYSNRHTEYAGHDLCGEICAFHGSPMFHTLAWGFMSCVVRAPKKTRFLLIDDQHRQEVEQCSPFSSLHLLPLYRLQMLFLKGL